jgi:hypothetical protein
LKLNLVCQRFKKLWNEQDERPLTQGELRFLEKHRITCEPCREFEASTDSAMSVLREAALNPMVSESFDERVIRRARVQTVRQSLGYWSPALIGGALACITLMAVLQIAAAPVQLKKATLPQGEARIAAPDRALPSLILQKKPHFDQ